MKYSLQLLVLDWKQQRESRAAASKLLAPESVVLSDPRDTTSLERLAATLVVKHPLASAVGEMMFAVLAGSGLAWIALSEEGREMLQTMLLLFPFFGS